MAHEVPIHFIRRKGGQEARSMDAAAKSLGSLGDTDSDDKPLSASCQFPTPKPHSSAERRHIIDFCRRQNAPAQENAANQTSRPAIAVRTYCVGTLLWYSTMYCVSQYTPGQPLHRNRQPASGHCRTEPRPRTTLVQRDELSARSKYGGLSEIGAAEPDDQLISGWVAAAGPRYTAPQQKWPTERSRPVQNCQMVDPPTVSVNWVSCFDRAEFRVLAAHE